jgi:hypothetical protein
MSSITNVWIPEHLRPELRKAIEYYHFESMASYFRICGLTLIDHYQRRDPITMPFQFSVETTKNKKAK